jgi:hypothetical protein
MRHLEDHRLPRNRHDAWPQRFRRAIPDRSARRLPACLTAAVVLLAGCTGAAAQDGISRKATNAQAPVATATPLERASPTRGVGPIDTLAVRGDGIPGPSVFAAIHVGNGPTGLIPFGDKIAVALQREGRFELIDPATATGAGYLDAPVDTGGTVIGDQLWAAEFHSGTVSRIDIGSGKTTLTLHVTGASSIQAGEDGIWIGSQTEPSASLVDGSDGHILRTIPLPGSVISGLWVLDGSIWVDALGSDGEALFRLDPRSGDIEATLPYVRADDVRLAFGSIWVTSTRLGYVVRIDPATNRFVSATRLAGPNSLASDADGLWATESGIDAILRIDGATGTASAATHPGFPTLCCPLAAFGSVWVSSTDANVVLQLDPEVLRSR